uniref:GIY-YIG domain-containing protein n=1 Tax=Stropharia rugosoannulata TaxID=68746 RepID=A0A3G9HFB1_9AGAR|nr:hypothetical protein [Stropharia rugosoannulata]
MINLLSIYDLSCPLLTPSLSWVLNESNFLLEEIFNQFYFLDWHTIYTPRISTNLNDNIFNRVCVPFGPHILPIIMLNSYNDNTMIASPNGFPPLQKIPSQIEIGREFLVSPHLRSRGGKPGRGNLNIYPPHLRGAGKLRDFSRSPTKLFQSELHKQEDCSGQVCESFKKPNIKEGRPKQPVRIYTPKIDRNLIGFENKNRTIIYQWINLINGKRYVGSAWYGSRILLSYWTPSVLKRNLPIYKSICYYTQNNFMLVILEDLGKTGSVSKEYMLSREQYYLDILFKVYPLFVLNQSPTAGTTLGFKHSPRRDFVWVDLER